MGYSLVLLTVLHAGEPIMILNDKSRIRDYMRFTFILLILGILSMTSVAYEIKLRIRGGDVDFEGAAIRTAITLPAGLRDKAVSSDVMMARDGTPGMMLRG